MDQHTYASVAMSADTNGPETHAELRGQIVGVGFVDLLAASQGVRKLIMIRLVDLFLEYVGRSGLLLLK